MPRPAAAGSTFLGWTGACSGTAATCTVVMSADQTVSAKFSGVSTTGVRFLLDFKGTMSGGLGAIGSAVVAASSPLGCVDNYCEIIPDGMRSGSVSLLAGTKVTLVASVFGGATFRGWGDACSGLQPVCTVVMDSPQHVSALFAPLLDPTANVGGGTGQFMLNLNVSLTGKGSGTVSASPAGLNCGGPCGTANSGGGFAYAAGTVITPTASPDNGSTFVGWGGACSGTGTCSVTMNSVQSVTATFSAP